jgi:hypothetical protein
VSLYCYVSRCMCVLILLCFVARARPHDSPPPVDLVQKVTSRSSNALAMCPHTLIYTCPHITDMILNSCVLILLHICLYLLVRILACVLILLLYVSSYCNVCVLLLMYICVLVLLYKERVNARVCHAAQLCVSSYCSIWVLYCPHTNVYFCPHTP